MRDPAFQRLSGSAIRLLLAIAEQWRQDNNGALGASLKRMKEHGFKGNGTLMRARKELLEAGFIIETRKGHMPNRESWFALTFHQLDKIDGMDISPKAFEFEKYKTTPVVRRRHAVPKRRADTKRHRVSEIGPQAGPMHRSTHETEAQ